MAEKNKDVKNVASNRIIKRLMYEFPQLHGIAKALLFERGLKTKGVWAITDDHMKDFIHNYISNAFMPHFSRGKFIADSEFMTAHTIEGLDGEDDAEMRIPTPELEFSAMIIAEMKIVFGILPKRPFEENKRMVYFSKATYNNSAKNWKVVREDDDNVNVLEGLAGLFMSNQVLTQRILSFIGAFEYILGEPIHNGEGLVGADTKKIIMAFIEGPCKKYLNFASILPIYKILEKGGKDRTYDFFSLDADYVDTNTAKLDRPIMDLVFTTKRSTNTSDIKELGWLLFSELANYFMAIAETIEDKLYEIESGGYPQIEMEYITEEGEQDGED